MRLTSIRGCPSAPGDESHDHSFRLLFPFDFTTTRGLFGRKMLRKIKKSGDLEGRMHDGGSEEL